MDIGGETTAATLSKRLGHQKVNGRQLGSGDLDDAPGDRSARHADDRQRVIAGG